MNKIRLSATTVVFLLLAITLLYKGFEWNTVNNLQKLYSSSITQELRLISDITSKNKDTFIKVKDFYSAGSGSAELQASAYADLEGSVELNNSFQKDYIKLDKENEKAYERINYYLKFFIGSNIKSVKKLVADQLAYYKIDIAGAEDTLIQAYFYKNLFMVINDNYIINNFNRLATNKELSKKNFYLLPSLSKYSEDSFKFDNEESIKKYGPQEYQTLSKYKRYFSTFYELIKMWNKDQESTENYKNVWNKLQQDMSNVNPDFANMFSDKKDIQIERTKNTIAVITDQIKQVYGINKQNTFSYPLIGAIKFNKYQLLQCQLYDVKASLFFSFKKKYPDLKNVQQFILDLNQITPKTTEIDKFFNKDILKIEDKSDEFIYSCIDKDNNEIYSFITLK